MGTPRHAPRNCESSGSPWSFPGAAMAGALKVAHRLESAGEAGVVVTVFPDRADRYFEPARWDKEFQW